MSYPKRSRSHVFETNSEAILRLALPCQWLCRKPDERDYGVDFYIEMVGQEHRLTGHIAAVQLKAMQRVTWRGQSRQGFADWFYSRRIPKETVSYWMALQLPVFLCVAELPTQKVFFAPVKRAIRSHYAPFLKNKTFPFRLFRFCDLTNRLGRYTFTQEYYRERGYDRFIQRIMDIVAHQEQYLKLFRLAADPRANMIVRPEDWVTATNLVQTCLIILEHTGNRSEQERLGRHLGSLPKVSVRSKSKRSREVFASMLRELYPIFGKCLRAAENYVTKQESEFWQATDAQFHKICSSLVKKKLPRFKFQTLIK